jgi:hypothetical protein
MVEAMKPLQMVPTDGPEAERQHMLDVLELTREAVEAGEVTGLVIVTVCDGRMGVGDGYRICVSRSALFVHESAWAIDVARAQLVAELVEGE